MTRHLGVPLASLEPPSSEDLTAYRAAATRLAFALEQRGPGESVPRLADGEPDLGPVLEGLPGGADAALRRIEAEVRGFRPSARSNVRTAADYARLLLLQQIDVLWWSAAAPFVDDAEVRACPDLVALRGQVGFHYKVATRAWPTRARNYAVRRWAPDHEPRSSGLSYDRARPAVLGLLNDVAARFAAAEPAWSRGLWVNCLVRSEAVQERLRELGYSAATASSHCAGYAADVEMTWLARHGRVTPLQEILLGLRDEGTINLIDEGQAWHLCLSPAWVSHYEQRYEERWTCAG